MTGTSLKLWKLFSNITLSKNIQRNPPVVPVVQQLLGFVNPKPFASSALQFPEKPKKPMTAYLEFYMSLYPSLKKQHPDKRIAELSRLASERWKVVDPSEKAKMVEDFKKKNAEYLIAKEHYLSSLTPEMRKVMAEEKQRKLARKKKKKAEGMGRPKKPLTPWITFVTSKNAGRKDMPFKDFMKSVSEEWFTVDLKVKKKMNEEFLQKLEKYREDLDKWEAEMVRKGHPDLIREGKQIRVKTKAGLRKRARKAEQTGNPSSKGVQV